MNKVILMGRLTRDPDIRYSNGQNGQMAIARFTLAVDRRSARRNENAEQTADFISCVAFGSQAEFAEKYLRKGTRMVVCGRLQTGSYDKNGTRVYTTDVIVEELEFAESKSGSGNNAGAAGNSSTRTSITDDSFMNLPDDDDMGLPFH